MVDADGLISGGQSLGVVAQFSELAAEVGQGGGEVGQVQAGQDTRGYSPVETGFAYLPMVVISLVGSVGSNIVLLPRTGPKPLVAAGMLLAAGGMVWLTRICGALLRRGPLAGRGDSGQAGPQAPRQELAGAGQDR
jgi:hypothetical protein